MSDNTQEKGKKKSTDDSDLQCITPDKENSEVPTSLLRGSMKYKYAMIFLHFSHALRSKENISRIH